MGNFFGGGWYGTANQCGKFGKIRKNLENRENSGGGQGLNWGGTKCPKIFLGGAILSHPPPTAEVCTERKNVQVVKNATESGQLKKNCASRRQLKES